jgi:integrase
MTTSPPPADDPAKVLTVAGLTVPFLSWAESNLAPSTLAVRRRYLGWFCEHFGPRVALDIRVIDIYQWLDSHDWNRSTRSLAIAAVRRLFSWSWDAGLLDSNPIARIKRPGYARRERCPTAEEVALILAHLRSDAKGLAECLLETGARPGELIRATFANVKDDRIELAAHKTGRKTGRKRIIFLTPRAIEIVKESANQRTGLIFTDHRGTAWTTTNLNHRFTLARAKAGLSWSCSAYHLRHYYATQALVRGVPIAILATLLGTSVKIIESNYSHLSERHDELRRWVG